MNLAGQQKLLNCMQAYVSNVSDSPVKVVTQICPSVRQEGAQKER